MAPKDSPVSGSRILPGGTTAVIVLAAGGWFLTERPVTVTVVEVEADVPLRLYGLGTVEARVLSRVGFEVGATLVSA